MDKIYIVKYTNYNFSDCGEEKISFATTKKTKATKYSQKFNKIVKKYSNHYKQFESNEFGFNWIKDEYVKQHFRRWNQLRNIGNCYWEEIKIR